MVKFMRVLCVFLTLMAVCILQTKINSYKYFYFFFGPLISTIPFFSQDLFITHISKEVLYIYIYIYKDFAAVLLGTTKAN